MTTSEVEFEFWEKEEVTRILEKIFIIFDAFKKVQAHIPSVFLLFIGEKFWDQLGTNFLHTQFEGQNFVDGLAIQIQHTTDNSDCQTSIKPHEIPHFGHIFVRLKCKIFHNKVRLPLSHGHPKMLYAT